MDSPCPVIPDTSATFLIPHVSLVHSDKPGGINGLNPPFQVGEFGYFCPLSTSCTTWTSKGGCARLM